MEEHPVPDPLVELQEFIDSRWSVAQPEFYLGGPTRLRAPAVTETEASRFLAAARSWLKVDDERKLRSNRFPRLRDGGPRGYNFFESHTDRTQRGRLRAEWVVHFAAAERLRDEFGWPPDRLVFESPKVLDGDGVEMLKQDALDILLLREPCGRVEWEMPIGDLRSQVIVEAKFNVIGAGGLDEMIRNMQECDGADHDEHTKCRGLQVFRPDFFLGVAASETWRLFKVEGDDHQLVLGDEIPPEDQGPYLRFTP